MPRNRRGSGPLLRAGTLGIGALVILTELLVSTGILPEVGGDLVLSGGALAIGVLFGGKATASPA